MIYRHLVTKSFDWGLVSKSLILDNSSVFTKLEKKYGNVDRKDYSEEVIKSFPDKISLGMNLSPIRDLIKDNEDLEKVLLNGTEIKSLSNIFKDKDSWAILSDEEVDNRLREVASEMFSLTNPLTKDKDVFRSERYASSIPIVTLTGTFPPQVDEENNTYFNPDGCVTVAEFLDSLNAIEFGSNSNQNRKKSLDNISDEKDFFNEGYQSCANKYSSPFFNLYTRLELLQPIIRIELAYITVVCWSEFRKKFDSIFTGKYSLGVTLDWNTAGSSLSDFEDGFDYKVSKRLVNDNKVLSINIKDYISDKSMSEFKSKLKEGVVAVPYPMFLSLIELDSLGLFYFKDSRLDPLKEVSRGELSYFLVRLAKVFGGAE